MRAPWRYEHSALPLSSRSPPTPTGLALASFNHNFPFWRVWVSFQAQQCLQINMCIWIHVNLSLSKRILINSVFLKVLWNSKSWIFWKGISGLHAQLDKFGVGWRRKTSKSLQRKTKRDGKRKDLKRQEAVSDEWDEDRVRMQWRSFWSGRRARCLARVVAIVTQVTCAMSFQSVAAPE